MDIDIEDDGRIMICSPDENSIEKARTIIKQLTAEPEIGKIYKGVVAKIMDFGAFVEIMPNASGLVHISEIAENRIEKVTDVLKVGQEVMVKLVQIDDVGRLNLSIKQAKKQ